MKNRVSRSRFPEYGRRPENGSEHRKPGWTSGRVFVFAAGGLRCANAGSGERTGFLGYTPKEIFWRDVLEIVHEDDLAVIWSSIFRIMESPGASESVRVRMREAGGAWLPVEAAVQNVLEVPGDGGLIVVNMRPVAG